MNAAAPITIGMPVYNGGIYLADAVESILAQTLVDFELVISDNGSTDESEDIIRSYAAHDSRILYLRQPANLGAAWNFNRVFAECRSPFFKWAASDDLLAPTCVERCHDVLIGAPRGTVVMASPETDWIGPDGQFLRHGDDAMHVAESTPRARLGHVVRHVGWVNTLFGLVASDALRRTRGLGAYPSSDWVLLGELALLGQLWMFPERLFLRREHGAMSHAANSTPIEVAQWLDPSTTKVQKELVRVYFEYLRAIEHASLTRPDKLGCAVTMTSIMLHRRYLELRADLALRTRLRALMAGRPT